MKNATASLLGALLLQAATHGVAQTTKTVTIPSGNYSVETNQVVTLVGYDWYTRPLITGTFPDGTSTTISPYVVINSAFNSWGPSGYFEYSPPSFQTSTPIATQVFTGLTNIWVSAPSATFKIETPSAANVVSNYVPADAIVIPASATGSVQIILESSPDLVNWTAANPGTYGASAGTNRFFRVRAMAGQ
jgi:hypothetical protein